MLSKRKIKIGNSFGKNIFSYNRHATLQQKCAEKLNTFLPERAPKKILEIGCGTGFLTTELQKKYPESEIIAIDIAEEMILACQKKFIGHPNLSFCVMDGENITIERQFDLIVSNLTIQWFETPVESVEKLYQNLTDQGEIYFSTIGKRSFQEWRQILNDLSLKSGLLEAPNYNGIFHEIEETITYKNGLDFLKNFKKIGAQQPKEGYQTLNPKYLQKALSDYDYKYNGTITWHILYGRLQKSGDTLIAQTR